MDRALIAAVGIVVGLMIGFSIGGDIGKRLGWIQMLQMKDPCVPGELRDYRYDMGSGWVARYLCSDGEWVQLDSARK